MFKAIFGFAFLCCLCILALLVFRSAEEQRNAPHTFKAGDYVQVKLTGDIGMITQHLWGERYTVTLQNYDTKIFNDFELTSAEERDIIRHKNEGNVLSAEQTPSQVFNNDKVWNPQTEQYEPR